MEVLRWEFGAIKARQEWEEDSKRYRRMQKHLRDNAYLVGRPPFGYRVICAEGCGPVSGKHDHHKTLEPDPKISPFVLEMVDRFLAGQTLTSICDWLDSEGVKPLNRDTPSWQLKVVRGILSNPALIGKRKDAESKTILRFTSILTDMAKWRALQYRLDHMPRKVAVAPDTAVLTGLIFCDKCKGVVHRRRVYNVRKDGSRQYNVYYRCDGTVRNRSTCRNMRPLAYVDAYVDTKISTWDDPIITRRYVPSPSPKDYQDDIDGIDEQIDDLDKSDPAYLEKVGELWAQRKRLVDEAAKADDESGFSHWIWTQGEKYSVRWLSLTTDQERREMLLDLGVKVYMHPDLEPRIERPEPG